MDDGKRLELSEFALDVAYTGGAKMGRESERGGVDMQPCFQTWLADFHVKGQFAVSLNMEIPR